MLAVISFGTARSRVGPSNHRPPPSATVPIEPERCAKASIRSDPDGLSKSHVGGEHMTPRRLVAYTTKGGPAPAFNLHAVRPYPRAIGDGFHNSPVAIVRPGQPGASTLLSPSTSTATT